MHTPLPPIVPCTERDAFDPHILLNIEWTEGSMSLVQTGLYGRHGNFVFMTERGSQEAQFANGKRRYFALVGIVGGDGVLRPYGGHIIWVLPNGNVLIVVNTRPGILAIGGRRSNILTFTDGRPNFDMGPMGSLEFPGGSINPGESVKAGMLREGFEETGVVIPKGVQVRTLRGTDPVMLQIAEIIIAMYHRIIFLPEGSTFPNFVQNDGGLHVISISPGDLLLNVDLGAVVAGSTLASLLFFLRVTSSSLNREPLILIERGAVVEEYMTLD